MRIGYTQLLAIVVLIVVVILAVIGLPALAAQSLLSDVTCTPSAISPDGDALSDGAKITYTISRRADVKVQLVAEDGTEYQLREQQTRTPDAYQITFNGAVPVPDTANARVLPNGQYTIYVEAIDENGQSERQSCQLAIENADTVAPEITEIVTYPASISPNGDAHEDEMNISYTLSKKAETTVYLTDANGQYHLIDPPKTQEAAMQSFVWNGTENGGRLLPDGEYTYHIVATDLAGNITEATGPVTIDNGGTPRLEITQVKFAPTAIPIEGKVHVQITVKNTGDTVIEWDESMGPPPGTEYTTSMTYGYWRDDEDKPLYYERYGVWRVGVMWTNAAMSYPVRWGIGKTLAPGEQAVITGDIQVLQRDKEIYFWTSVEQGGVGFPGGQKGQTRVIVSY